VDQSLCQVIPADYMAVFVGTPTFFWKELLKK